MYLIYIMYVCNDVPTITTILFKIKHLFELKVQKRKETNIGTTAGSTSILFCYEETTFPGKI